MNLNKVRTDRTEILNYIVSTVRKSSNIGRVYETIVLRNEHHWDLSDEFDGYARIFEKKSDAMAYHSDMVRRIQMAYFKSLESA